MKKCAECGYSNQIETGYCIVCGSSLETLQSVKRARFLFFITPFFIIAIFSAFLHELGSKHGFASNIILGGDFALIYLVVGLCFWLSIRLFNIKTKASSSWLAGMFAVVHLLACSLLINLFTNNSNIVSLDEDTYIGIKWLGIIFLPTFFTGLFSIVAKAEIENSKIKLKISKWLKFAINNFLLIILLSMSLIISFVYFSNPSNERELLKARLLFDLQAYERAMVIIDANINPSINPDTTTDTITALSERKLNADFLCLKSEILFLNPSLNIGSISALDYIKQASILAPKNAGFKMKLGLAYDLEDNREQAIFALNESTELASSSSIVWQILGNLQTKYGNNEEAIKSFNQALKLKPQDPLLMNNLSFTLLESNKDLPIALELAKESVKKMPNALFNLDTLAWAYYKNGDANAALEVMNKIHSAGIELTSEIEFHYAVILYRLNLLKKPIEALNNLLQKTDVLTNLKLKKEINSTLKSIQREQVK